MEQVKNYTCPCCGAPLAFSGQSQSLHCGSCGNDYSVETMELLYEAQAGASAESKYDWNSYEPRSFDSVESDQFSTYTCPSCGAEITGDDTMGSTVCPYCGNATIVQKQFEGTLRPDYIIPFKVEKDEAIRLFEAEAMKKPFIPDEFKNKKRIAEMAGVYIPFWMFDCDCDAAITYNAEFVTAWSDSKYDYVKTDHFKLFRQGSVGFSNIPVDGLIKAEDKYMDALEPFDYSEAVNFNPAYLSGYLADKYDVSADESMDRANRRVKQSTEDLFKQTTNGYALVTPEQSTIQFTDGKIRYSLLPVWMLNIKYNNQMYKYAINGQTGKVVGEFPTDEGKKKKYFIKKFLTFGLPAAVIAALALLFLV